MFMSEMQYKSVNSMYFADVAAAAAVVVDAAAVDADFDMYQ